MRVLLSSFMGFLTGLIVGYLSIVSGWVAYAVVTRVADPGGGQLIRVWFLAAPGGALAAGLVGAFWFALRAARRLERTSRRAMVAPAALRRRP